ncbi:transglutaminaseTgpA domain-containing protein [Nocardioides sp. Root151]|uniref:transglutaminase family protein n=1 Tax=Nocardioides sp. Root151 TaxID=1736475 RepID=UPI0007038AC4|nr:DUF3488 and transglutaminase-like domain-containing protein [Nocardioides sp. Root151]
MTGRAHAAVSLPLVMATAVTSWFALWSWGGFVQASTSYLPALFFGIPFISAIGVLTRWVRFPIIVVVAAQLLGVLLFANAVYGTSVIPTGGSVTAAAQAFADSLEAMRQYAAPVPTHVREVGPVLVLGGLVCHVLVDLCAVTLARVPVAGLPLLIIYTLPVSILDKSVNWLVFVLTVTGFLMMLALQEGGRISRWGRQFGAPVDAERMSVFGGRDARRHPVALGASATALALFVPLLIPTLDLNLIGGDGPGGDGDREVRITNPMTDLKRDLVQGADVPLVRVDSPGPAPEYLRTSVLTTFTGQAWTPGNRDLEGDQGATGEMPYPIGLSNVYPTRTRDWKISISDNLKSWWLPTPMYVASIEAGSEWRYDAEILDFYTADEDQDTRGLNYSLTELIPDFSGQELADAGAPPSSIQTRFTALPQIPDEVTQLAHDLTKDFDTDFEKAQAIQRYFRGGDFRYSTTPDPGNGNDALVEFLQDKVGYCEQFASAMAVMARSVDIPARVAVGFFQADELSSGEYEFSSKDLHAWPELYFEDAGWVKFEPTPSSHIGSVPSYTNDRIDRENPDNDPSNQTSSSAPTRRPSGNQPSTAPQQEDKKSDGDKDNGLSVIPFLWGGGGLLLLIGLALAPRMLRRTRATRRWHAGGDPAEVAWVELRDVVVDVGRAWPSGRSPRATGREIAEFFGAEVSSASEVIPPTGPETNPAAMRSLTALVAALEQSRYAATPTLMEVDEARSHLDHCIGALRGGVTQRARWRADWLPASLLSPAPSSASARAAAGRRHRTGPIDQMS